MLGREPTTANVRKMVTSIIPGLFGSTERQNRGTASSPSSSVDAPSGTTAPNGTAVNRSPYSRAGWIGDILSDLASAWTRWRCFPASERIEFYHLMAGLAHSKRALPPAVQDLAEQHRALGKETERAYKSISARLKNGGKFRAALDEWVPRDELAILSAVDRGSPGEAFAAAARALEAQDALSTRVVAMLAYPVLLIGGMLSLMRYYASAFLIDMAAQIDTTKLPRESQWMLEFMLFVGQHVYAIAAIVIALLGALLYSMPRWHGPWRAHADRWFFPYAIHRTISATRFLLGFTGLQVSRVPVGESLGLLSKGVTPYLQHHLELMYRRARGGKTDPQTFSSGLLDPSMTVALSQLLATRDAEQALPRIAETLIQMTDRRVARIAGIIGLASLVVVGLFVAGVVMLLFDLGSVAAAPNPLPQ